LYPRQKLHIQRPDSAPLLGQKALAGGSRQSKVEATYHPKGALISAKAPHKLNTLGIEDARDSTLTSLLKWKKTPSDADPSALEAAVL
jgi:hypothetical protein